jgi:hypothetical protein
VSRSSLKVVVDLDVLPQPTGAADDPPDRAPDDPPHARSRPAADVAPTPRPTRSRHPTPPAAATPDPDAGPHTTVGGFAGPRGTPPGAGSTPGGPSGDAGGSGSHARVDRERVDDPSPSADAGLAMPAGPTGPSSGGTPPITLTSGFETPMGDGFEWAVPGLVLSVPGLLIVLLAIGVQLLGAAAWLPIVRRRIGAFGFGRRAAARRPGPAQTDAGA